MKLMRNKGKDKYLLVWILLLIILKLKTVADNWNHKERIGKFKYVNLNYFLGFKKHGWGNHNNRMKQMKEPNMIIKTWLVPIKDKEKHIKI